MLWTEGVAEDIEPSECGVLVGRVEPLAVDAFNGAETSSSGELDLNGIDDDEIDKVSTA